MEVISLKAHLYEFKIVLFLQDMRVLKEAVKGCELLMLLCQKISKAVMLTTLLGDVSDGCPQK